MKKESDRKKRVAIYTRVSSEEQKREGISLDAQKRRLEDYAQQKDFWVYKIYTDAGISGKSIKGRKAFQECLSDARSGKFSAILITKLDRAFRNVVEAIMIVEELQKLKIDFISLSEQIDSTTAMGKFFFIIMSALAQLEREMTADRVREVNLDKFERGVMIGKAPVGYKWSKRKKMFLLDPDRAEKVRDVFLMTASGKRWKDICDKHNIAKSTYYNVIKNEFYAGIIVFNGEKKTGTHEPLVEKEVFDKCQRIRER